MGRPQDPIGVANQGPSGNGPAALTAQGFALGPPEPRAEGEEPGLCELGPPAVTPQGRMALGPVRDPRPRLRLERGHSEGVPE